MMLRNIIYLVGTQTCSSASLEIFFSLSLPIMSFSYWKTIQILPIFVRKIFDTLILPILIYSKINRDFTGIQICGLGFIGAALLYRLSISTYCWFSSILLSGNFSNTLFACDLCIKNWLTVDVKLKGLDQERRWHGWCKSLFSHPSGNDWLLWFLSIGIYAFDIPSLFIRSKGKDLP